MRSLLVGFAGVSPKSAVPNLVELFSALIAKAPLESKEWILDVLHGVSVVCFILYPFSGGLIPGHRVISSDLAQVQKPRTL
jgi:hypothetical protein